ncbi:hypothetical protein KI429_07375 [Pseudomonas shirazica]|nr:hypothetical protein KI429_07375 [Pseudomonas shirazica]
MSIRTTPVTAKSAWTPHDLANDNSWLYRLDSRGVEELEALLDKVRHLPITEITKADFPSTIWCRSSKQWIAKCSTVLAWR